MKIGITSESHQLLAISTLDLPLVSQLFAKSTEVKKLIEMNEKNFVKLKYSCTLQNFREISRNLC